MFKTGDEVAIVKSNNRENIIRFDEIIHTNKKGQVFIKACSKPFGQNGKPRFNKNSFQYKWNLIKLDEKMIKKFTSADSYENKKDFLKLLAERLNDADGIDVLKWYNIVSKPMKDKMVEEPQY